MANQSDLHFSFQPVVGKSQFEVVSFTLEETLSTPFRLTLDLVSHADDVDFGHLLDQPVLFTIWRGEDPLRYVHGLVSTFTQRDTGFCRTYYRAVVEPQLARAGLRSNWRIFQHKSVPQILDIMLRAQGLQGFELRSEFEHQVREFCVQADETDLAFIHRLAAEEGYLYRFEHSARDHRLFMTDRLLGMGWLGPNNGSDVPSVRYNPKAGGDRPEPALRTLSYSEQVRTARQVQRDYTFKHPAYRQEHSAAASDLDHQSTHYERFDYPGRYKRDIAGKPATQLRMTALRHDARLIEVEGDDLRLQPGLSFNLADHPREDLNVHWRVKSVHHQGTQFTSLQEEAAGAERGTHYEQKAVLIPGRIEWKPELLAKPRVDGPHMATVVGPEGEEIYCDEWGRVKVSFPWDRESRNNEFSSCWVRVAQGWAGGMWGSMAVPRIGQEVIIQYLGADPDQPLITGRTYCANQLPPYDLPKHKTRMTIKSRTHKGQGFNELRFEDELGHQEVFIHAERDQNNVVKHNETTVVGNDRSERVEHNENVSIGDNRTEDVGRDETIRIGESRHVTVGADKTEIVRQSKTETIGAAKVLAVGGLLNVTVGLAASEQVGLDKQVEVGQQLGIVAGDDISISSRQGEVHISSARSLTLSCDGAFIRLANGRIELGSPEPMLIQAVGEIKAPARFDLPPAPGNGEVEFRLVRHDGSAIAGGRYTARLSDGSQRAGVVDQDGYARLLEVTPGVSAQVEYEEPAEADEATGSTGADGELRQLLARGGQS